MNFNIYINDELGYQLAHVAKIEGKSRNALIRDALNFYIKNHTDQSWPSEILNFSGIKQEFLPFEAYRTALKSITDKDIF